MTTPKKAPKKTAVEKAIDEVSTEIAAELPAAAESPEVFECSYGGETYQAYWWRPEDSSPKASFVVPGRIFDWCVLLGPEGAQQESKVCPDYVVARQERPKGGPMVIIWESLRECQKCIGVGIVPNEAPLLRGSRTIAAGPGRS
jgi:hypothetical protein